MALIKCPECSAEISDLAPSCPRCGAPRVPAAVPTPPKAAASSTEAAAPPAKISGGGVLGVIAAVVVFLLLGGGGIVVYVLNRAQQVVAPFAGTPSMYAPPPAPYVPPPPPPQEVFAERIQLQEGNARSFSFTMTAPSRIEVIVQAEPRAVDVLLMTEAEWTRYRRVSGSLFGGRYTYRQALSRPSILQMDESEVLPQGRWTVVLQYPSQSLLGGGTTNASVRILNHR